MRTLRIDPAEDRFDQAGERLAAAPDRLRCVLDLKVVFGQRVQKLTESLEKGLAELDEVVRRATRELGLGPSQTRRYLTECLSYRLDEDALAGLYEFYRRAALRGLIEEQRTIDFLGASELRSA